LGFKGYNFKVFWNAVIFYPKNVNPYLSTVNRHHKSSISTTNTVECIRKAKINQSATLLSAHTTNPNRVNKLIFFRNVQEGCEVHTAPCSTATAEFSPMVKRPWPVAHLHLQQKLRIRGAIPTHPLTPSWLS